MKLREVRIRNFRNLVDVVVPITDSTVLVGHNNSGKTAFLDAINKALPRTYPGPNSPFEEYDYHLSTPQSSPEKANPIEVELWFREDRPDEWAVEIKQDLQGILNFNPIDGTNSIGWKVTSKYSQEEKDFVADWCFLDLLSKPKPNRSPQNPFRKFLSYIRIFYISALRDQNDYFSMRSQYWGKILKKMRVNDNTKNQISELQLNIQKLIFDENPEIEQLSKTIETYYTSIVPLEEASISIQLSPLQIWEQMSKSELALNHFGREIFFPLTHQGQGTQSLIVLALFQGFLKLFLETEYRKETQAILAIEEPEAHLYPHAVRALSRWLSDDPAQKIISTHSPYLIQNVKINDVRLFRKIGSNTHVYYINEKIEIDLPEIEEIVTDSEEHGKNTEEKKLSREYYYDTILKRLIVYKYTSAMDKKINEWIKIYNAKKQTDAAEKLQVQNDKLKKKLSHDDITKFNKSQISRLRGEIFFARGWLFCEGPSDMIYLSFFAEQIKSSFDKYGVSIIDFKNHTMEISAYIKLSINFNIPYVAVIDRDDFQKHIEAARKVDLNADQYFYELGGSDGKDIEDVIAGHFSSELCEEFNCDQQNLAQKIRGDKISNAYKIIEILGANGITESRVPESIKKAIQHLIERIKDHD